jgi:hypothetical protein
MCAISDLIALIVSVCIGLDLPGPALMVFNRALRWAFLVLSVSDQLALFCIGLFITFILGLFQVAHDFRLVRCRYAIEQD